MKSLVRGLRRRLRNLTIAVGIALTLVSTGRTSSATVFPNYEIWQQNGFHGFNINSTLNEAGWAAFESTGANLGRIFVRMSLVSGTNTFAIASSVYTWMDKVVTQAENRNFKLVVTFDPQPENYWLNTAQQNSIIAALAGFARYYAGNPVFAGFDIINEPGPMSIEPSLRDAAWGDFAGRIIDGIRAQDPTRIIVFEWARWDTNYADLPRLPYGGVVYSSHWYMSENLTHQGVKAQYSEAIPYPTPSANPYGPYNRAIMKGYLQPVRDFQVRYDLPIYVGEFSCARWAPGRTAYYFNTDAGSIFNDFGWNWTYHQFRGYAGWDAELPRGGADEVRSMNTDLMRWLRQQMSRLNP